jgi:NADPH2:quinone reductase
MVYRRTGGPEVMQLENLPVPEPAPGEVLVRMAFSGVNPTDWKSRAGSGTGAMPPEGWQIPDQDGSGRIVAVGDEVDPVRLNERVWIWEAAYRRPWGTATEYTTVLAEHAVPLGPGASYELGAALGVPFLTAHRCLTVGEMLPSRLSAGALSGRSVLVQGGAGAVGNAAIQLARWAGATVISTVSSPQKARLAEVAGCSYVLDYRTQDVQAEVRSLCPDGVDVIVEVAASTNGTTDAAMLGVHGTVAAYGATGDDSVTITIRPMMTLSARWQFVLLYSTPIEAKAAAVSSVREAIAAGAVRVGDEVGLPIHRFGLEQAGDAHTAVAGGAIGKVVIVIDEDPAPSGAAGH